MAATLMVIARGHAAGLSADMHHCTSLTVPTMAHQAAHILKAFPVHVVLDPTIGPDAARITGMPARCILAILRYALWNHWADTTTTHQLECHCSVKSVVVPESGIAE